MTKRIDHVAAAESDIVSADDALESGADDVASAIAAVAQVHATLALVEQQRLANLIEVAKWNSRALATGARLVGDAPLDHDSEVARVDAIFAEVHEGLGL